MPALRTFLMLRARAGEWSVSVYRDLEGLLEAWKQRVEPDTTAAVLHVGFDRPTSRAFDHLADGQLGKLLVTGAAKFALPAGFLATTEPIGHVQSLPVFVATRGWGYFLDDEPLPTPMPAQRSREIAEGWLRTLIQSRPEAETALVEAGVYDDASYLKNEIELGRDLREITGLYRFESLIGVDRRDPCAFARAAPPWLSVRPFVSMDLSVRVSNLFSSMDIRTVADLSGISVDELLKRKNFGRKSVNDLLSCLENALAEGPFNVAARIDNALDTDLLASIRCSLLKYADRERKILSRRMGLDGPAETLQQIADDYGITRERVRQIEAKLLSRLIRDEYWDDLLTKKLASLLSDREVPLPAIGVEAVDSWFAGIAQRPDALRYVLLNICEARAGIVSVDGVDYFAFMGQEQWGATLAEATRLLESGVGNNWTETHCRTLIEGLLPAAAREFKSLLWEKASRLCHFAEDSCGEMVLSTFGRGAEHIVEAVLCAAERPLHFSEIAPLAALKAGRDIEIRRIHGAAAAVGILFGRGTYGVERHLPLNPDEMKALADEAEDLIGDGAAGRQWHANEILAGLIERGSSVAIKTDKYVLDIALQRSGRLERLGRMVWVQRALDGDDVARIDLRQAVIAVLQQAGRPLPTSEIKQCLVALRGVNEYFQIFAVDPLIKVGVGQWGLNDRDVCVKRADQPRLIERIIEILSERDVGIHLTEIREAIGDLKIIKDMEPVAIFGLAVGDDRIKVSVAQYLYLATWGGARRISISEAVNGILREAAEALTFDEIISNVNARILRRCERSAVSGCLQALDAVLDSRTGRWSLSPASQGVGEGDEIAIA